MKTEDNYAFRKSGEAKVTYLAVFFVKVKNQNEHIIKHIDSVRLALLW